jgi:hypothetical protein
MAHLRPSGVTPPGTLFRVQFEAMRREPLLRSLLASENPSIRWKVRVGVLGEDPASPAIRRLQGEIRRSPTVRALLSRRDRAGEIHVRRNPYDKWQGAHWVFAALADIGYPPGDERLIPLRDQVFALWLGDAFFEEFDAATRAAAYRGRGVPVMRGRHRRCASQQGNALLSATVLGLDDAGSERLAERLLHWQWPDGGWNCDKNPAADTSSFMETLLPMRGLALYGRNTKSRRAAQAAAKASEVFLSRQLFRRRSDRRVIAEGFTKLHYPLYWHYDVLGGLKAMADLDRLGDPRCAAALDLLEEKELPGGGWPAEARFFKLARKPQLGADYLDWGPVSSRRANAWVTADALAVLHAAGRA